MLALAVNASSLWSTFEYGKDSYRGKSNLTQNSKEPNNGLSKDYVYEYSQTAAENLTFLVPNAYGGESGLNSIDLPNSEFIKAFTSAGVPEDQIGNALQQLAGMGLQFTSYWGDKPITSGPHYLGSVICLLFIFGLFIVRSPLKWWLVVTVALTMLLSIGNSFPYVSDFFFNYFPLYNKFRAIESILAVTGLCIPILAFLAIREMVTWEDKAELFKKLKLSVYITGGLTLILIIYPQLFLSFKQTDQALFISRLAQVLKGDTNSASNIVNGLVKDRISLERSDAIRSLIFVGLTFVLLWAFIKQKLSVTVFSLALFALILVDLWQVDKRYLKDANFQEKVEADQVVKPQEVDSFIAKDPDPDFRVFDSSAPIKQDTYNPFFHKSISGYSAARLKRFDELIDGQLNHNPPNRDVLDMLNTKYLIYADTGNNRSMTTNQTACGHAWFVKSVKLAANADQEMQAISSFSPKDEVIVDKQYAKLFDEKQLVGYDPAATIKLVHYNPDHLVYQSGSTATEIAVFSEIYYDKGWKMLIDGKEQPYFRADYVLRAAQIPVGNHKIEFVFHPASYYTGEKISLAGSVLLLLALGGAVYTESRKKKPLVPELTPEPPVKDPANKGKKPLKK